MRRSLGFLLIPTLALLVTGCTREVPPRTNLSDGLVAAIQPIQAADVSVAASSNVPNGTIPMSAPPEGTRGDASGDVYNVQAASIFTKMANEYLASKFPNAKPGQAKTASLTLESITIQRYSNDSVGAMTMVALGGGEINWLQSVTVQVKASIGGQTRTIKATSEDADVQGMGTGTSTSAVYKGENSTEHKVGRGINAAINKALSLSNAFFDQNK